MEVVTAKTDANALGIAERHLLGNYRDEFGSGWQHQLIGAGDAAPVNRLEAQSHNRNFIGTPDTPVHRYVRHGLPDLPPLSPKRDRLAYRE